MQVPRCFRPWCSLSKIPGSRGLVGGPLPTFSHKPRCREYSPPHTSHYCCRLWIRVVSLSSRPLAPFLWCFALAKIHEKRHGSSIVSAAQVCRLGYSPGVKLEKAQRTLPPASNCIWFWYICCSTKLSRRERNF